MSRKTGDTTRTPRWVKAAGIVALVLIVLIAILLAAGGGSHGPDRHVGIDAPPTAVADHA